jgi:hypothetical protein
MSARSFMYWSDDLPTQMSRDDWKEAAKNKTRAQVIVFDAMFADVLGCLIRSALPSKDEVLGDLLNSMELNKRARLAYVLGLIGKGTMQDLHRIHNIRNKWAHVVDPCFSDREMRKDILALSTVGNKRNGLTEENYMSFCSKAIVKCAEAILNALERPIAETQSISGPQSPSKIEADHQPKKLYRKKRRPG